ncbi:DUF1513 domain-containing protein [Shimia sp. MMG029]|uniref:DUF1513 domain-containing protein n=1 Tax=Shimia sp. MMG029 TaxID=3021978 RepID=UPI0022FDE63D|nr:DUF1513 domain-containing protein [Shimia sp. MMG029]MDA5556833.1 DUF1513 domain-containing protein [Shimia sp. MMG029]
MVSRRRVLAGLAASSLLPSAGWASVGAPAFLSAARAPDGQFVLTGLTETGDISFTIPLPARGHAAAAHPTRAEAVAFARRPGTFALALDCRDGTVLARLNAPEGRHFYGHGAFSPNGTQLFTTENDYEAGLGVIGVWDVGAGYKRLGEVSSGGVGPHEMRLMPDGQSLVVANGGIETHPDMGRAKLNIPTMAPNLCYLDFSGTIVETASLPATFHKNSIRHLALHSDGTVALAMQWQGAEGAAPPLLGLHRRGGPITLLAAPERLHGALDGYAGSVAISGDGREVAITSPRGGVVHVFDLASGTFLRGVDQEDVCGIGARAAGFFFTTGTGAVGALGDSVRQQPVQFDNHLVPIGM